MNIAEILKNVPRGTKLYSPAFGVVTFKKATGDIIVVDDSCNIERVFFSDGRFYKDSECVLFPSRENRDWSNYKFLKAGDFIVRDYIGNKYIGIFSHVGHQSSENAVNCYCSYHCDSQTLTIKSYISLGNYEECRLATNEEKVLLLGVINKKGYVWNECALSIDRIHKFDINTLNPFDKVLTRDNEDDIWSCNLFSNIDKHCGKIVFICINTYWNQCIPYNDDTKHLVGTKEDCPKYYKTWE